MDYAKKNILYLFVNKRFTCRKVTLTDRNLLERGEEQEECTDLSGSSKYLI